jgi:hypothetical protein
MAKFYGKTYVRLGKCQNSTTAVDTAKLLAGHAIQALNHKDITGALKHLNLVVHDLGLSGNSNSNLNSTLVSHTRMHIPGITSQQSSIYACLPDAW